MSDANKLPRSSDRNRPSNRPHRERRHQDRSGAESNHSGRRSREDHRDPRESHQSKPYPSRQSYPSSERYDPRGEPYSRPPRLPPAQPNSRPSSSSPPYYSSASQTNTSPKESFGTKCSYLCSRRGVLQFSEIITNLMVLICVAASQAAISGYTSMGGLGTGAFSIDSAYSPFQGTELEQVRDLDMQFSQMRTPGVYAGVVSSIVAGSVTLLFLVGGAKPLHRLSSKFLMAEFVFNILACIGYIVGVGLYLHLIITVNSTEVCRLRNRLYAGHGYTFMNCDVQGGDAAVALFGLISACLYCASAVFSFLALRTLKKITEEMNAGNAVHQDFEEVEYKECSNHQDGKADQQLTTLV
ncbi:MARVEL domain-containing protein 3-like [Carcharodon carcharias]|uniref:MARVEL domain-containing protein 3-like n=1 Tax=Carcharodon carcharias TaxID=13397 RepID=UPI001B7DA83D|nr:MARVEL domain-containing protein 3-like [Carcharodon carcharias]XP_041039023.1 MARVEL domain-containing protein 3-like [Carcharodon carcharias]XP_041039024.1 MARVEL domain-containing protein 3-like [Carcharodon carcharias]